MKNTFLVLNDPKNPKSGLRVATLAEWDQILKANKELPREQRRFFIADSFEDCGEIDCMYIETTREEYNKWHSDRQEIYRKRKCGDNYSVFPFSEPVYGSEEELELEDTVSDGFDLEEYVTDSVLIDEIREAVKKRNVWEIDFFDYCLNGSFRSCNKEMREKYCISHETLNRRKQKFILFLKNFLKGVEK